MHPDVRLLIGRHRLSPLPVEGTLFVQTYRSAAEISPGRPAGTAMLGLYCEDPPSRSLLHRLTLDELWHFHAGDPLRLLLLHPDGRDEDIVLGPDPAAGHLQQFLVPAGVWQAGELVPGGRYALYGCTLSPGWTPDCFEGGTLAALSASHPRRAVDIARLACPDHDIRMPPAT
jgi:predicted cupin superfamily sugar epimerase